MYDVYLLLIRMMYISAAAYLTTMALASIQGIIAFAYYDGKGCDPLVSKQISNPNQVIAVINNIAGKQLWKCLTWIRKNIYKKILIIIK